MDRNIAVDEDVCFREFADVAVAKDTTVFERARVESVLVVAFDADNVVDVVIVVERLDVCEDAIIVDVLAFNVVDLVGLELVAVVCLVVLVVVVRRADVVVVFVVDVTKRHLQAL